MQYTNLNFCSYVERRKKRKETSYSSVQIK